MPDGTLSKEHRRNHRKNFTMLGGLLTLIFLLFAVTVFKLDGG